MRTEPTARRASRAPRALALALCASVALASAALGGAGCAPRKPPQKPLRQPTSGEVLTMRYQLAEALVARRRWAQAAPYVRDLLNRRPKDARLHLLLGMILREQGVLGAAETEIKKSIKLQPKAPDAYAALAVLHTKRRKLALAEASLRKALALSPKNARLRSDLGFCLLLQRRLAAAQRELEEAVRLDPTNRRAYNNLGLVLGLRGHREAAMKAFRQAGSMAMALTNMGFVAQMRGQPLQARRYYERALKRHHNFGPALRNLRTLDPNAAAAAGAAKGTSPASAAKPAQPADTSSAAGKGAVKTTAKTIAPAKKKETK